MANLVRDGESLSAPFLNVFFNPDEPPRSAPDQSGVRGIEWSLNDQDAKGQRKVFQDEFPG